MAAPIDPRRDRNVFQDFFDDFFADPDLDEVGEEAFYIDLQDVMLVGDIMDLDQAPNNRDFEADVQEGWSSEWGEGATVNMPFDRETVLNVGEDFPENPQPLDFFRLFVGDEMIDLLVEQTNDYAQRKIDAGNLKPHSRLHRWLPVTLDEMKVFLSLVIATGLVIKPTIEEYWSQDEITSTPFFTKNMSLVRFQAILSHFHLVDNTRANRADPLYKLRPFFTHLRTQFVEVYTPEQDISFDEATCPWKGRLRFRVYNPAKPDKFGIKLYEACEAKSGYVISMDVYQGSMPRTNLCEALQLDEDLGTTTQVVLGLLAFGGLLDKGHRIFMDNYYTSPELFNELYLLNTYACGTVRTSRRGMPEAFKKQKRGADTIKLTQGQTIFRQAEHLLAVKHHDKRDVHMLSTVHLPQHSKLDKVNDNGDPIWKPLCIVDYIKNMGGVDTSDQVIKNYSVLRKTVKWWRKLFFYLFTVAMCNAYFLHRKFAGVSLSHHEFRKLLVRQLISSSPEAPKPVPRGRKAVNPPRRMIGTHRPTYNTATVGAKRQRPQRDCVACNPVRQNRAGFKRKQSAYQCEQCQVTLCIPHCFEVYHTRSDYQRVLGQQMGAAEGGPRDGAGDN
ncbi:piggyBac transposable element-derived protein 4-like [Littorina saxatilis]|uniref:piggyBac transposable element-derived protein 4-like n=1 Tax=Littorina saxatilis TaxID=31220 RepID=UPI0038B61EF0